MAFLPNSFLLFLYPFYKKVFTSFTLPFIFSLYSINHAREFFTLHSSFFTLFHVSECLVECLDQVVDVLNTIADTLPFKVLFHTYFNIDFLREDTPRKHRVQYLSNAHLYQARGQQSSCPCSLGVWQSRWQRRQLHQKKYPPRDPQSVPTHDLP